MMSKILWQALKVAPAMLGVSLLFANSSIAAETKSKIARETRNDNLLAQTVNNSQGDSTPILEQIQRYNQDAQNGQGQIVNVFQLTDVSPGDWAFEALRSLVERYGCIVGYPDRTFRGNRALTRWEFAAGLNACLNQIERLIASSEAVLREDIDRLRRLLEEFQAELAALGVRVDDLEGRVAFLEDHQFSTTTKLRGEVIASFNIAGGDSASGGTDNTTGVFQYRDNTLPGRPRVNSVARETEPEFVRGAVRSINNIDRILFGPGRPNVVSAAPDDVQDRAVLSQRTRLNLDTSFTGRDRLRTRLEAKNVTRFDIATGVDTARLGYDAGSSDASDNDIKLGKLWYRSPLPFVDGLTIHLGLQDVDFDDISNPMNPFFESSGTGALSRFGRFNPAIYRTGGSQSLGINWQTPLDWFSVDVAYLTEGAADPSSKDGIGNGDYTATIQLNFEPTENLELSVSYGRSFYNAPETEGRSYRDEDSIGAVVNLSGSTGTQDAKNPFAYYQIVNPGAVAAGAPAEYDIRETFAASADRVGLQASWRATERFNVGGWFGWVNAIAEGGGRPSDAFLGIDALSAALPAPLTPGQRNAIRNELGANRRRGDTESIYNGAIHFAFLDLGIEGSVLGLITGVAPYTPDRRTLTGSDDVPIFVEGQYRIPIGTRFVITPGAYAVFNPNQNSDNDTVVVGSIRTTFKF